MNIETFDFSQKISNTSIAVMGAVCIILVIVAVIAFLFMKNNYPKNFMPILWGAIGYYLAKSCIFKLVGIGEGFLLQAIRQAEDASEPMIEAYTNIVGILFTLILALSLVLWMWAFYRFFILLKDRSTIARAASAGYGFALWYMIESFITIFSNWLYARLYNATTFEKLTEGMKEEELTAFKEFIIQFFSYKPVDYLAVVLENLAFLALAISVMSMIHVFLIKKEARKCFFRAIALVFIYYAISSVRNLGLYDSMLLQVALQVVVVFIGCLLSLRYLRAYAKEDFDYLLERYNKGALSMVFYDSSKEKKNQFADYRKLTK